MNELPEKVRRSGRQRRETKYFVPHFDESYMSPNEVKLKIDEMQLNEAYPRQVINHDNKRQNSDNDTDVYSSLKKEGEHLEPEEDAFCEEKALGMSIINSEDKSNKEDSLETKSSGQRKKRKTKLEKITELLKAIGDKPEPKDYRGRGNCVRAAIYRGHVKLTGKPSDMDQVVARGMFVCGHTGKATLRDLLNQPDYAGLDYEDGQENATVFCDKYYTGLEKHEECRMGMGRTYVTELCSGGFHFDTGKFHNHCYVCENFGTCISDYRMAHCVHCGKHFWAGIMGDKCDCQGPSTDDEDSEDNRDCALS